MSNEGALLDVHDDLPFSVAAIKAKCAPRATRLEGS